ncbi:MAG: hypothetical protein ABSG81_10810 [Acidimicrobiales bacterium]
MTPGASVVSDVRGREGERVTTAPRPRPFSVSSKAERLATWENTVTVSARSRFGAVLRMRRPRVRAWSGGRGPTQGDWWTSVTASVLRAATAWVGPGDTGLAPATPPLTVTVSSRVSTRVTGTVTSAPTPRVTRPPCP